MLGKSMRINRSDVQIQGFEDQLKQIAIQDEHAGDFSLDIAFKVGSKNDLSKRKLSFEGEDSAIDAYNF